MLNYTLPRNLRALFIAHYAPLLLIIMIGPMTAMFGVFEIPFNKIFTIILGVIIFLFGSFIYFKWEIFWYKEYKGQLVTNGIFKLVRHPHYTSILIVGCGLALFFYSTLALIISLFAFPLMVWSIIDEEKLLIKKYGDDYKKFMHEVPHRIIPKIF